MKHTMTDESIMHSGLVESVEGNVAHVRIERLSACAGCHAKGLCSIDKKKQTIDAYLNGVSVSEGQKVSIVGRMSSGMHAVVIAFVVPLAIMIALIAVLMFIGSSEITAAGAALGGLVFYYVMLIPFRKKLNRKFAFTIKPY